MMSVCIVESAHQESRKSKKQVVKGSNSCLKRQNEITDNDGVISGGNEKITYQQIEFLPKKIVFHELWTIVRLQRTWTPCKSVVCVVCGHRHELNSPRSSSQQLESRDACNNCTECMGHEGIINYKTTFSHTISI